MSEPQALMFETANVDETINVGRAIARLSRPGDVIALSGQLGAGKTQFVRGLAAALGAEPRAVSSPTFVIMQEYETDPPVLHIDAYRIESLDDVQTLGWTDELIAHSVTVIEWADRLETELPADRLGITIEHIGETARAFTLHPAGSWVQRMAMLRPIERPAGVNLSDVTCPVCGSPAAEVFHPFCSGRCKMVDLNRWFTGDYRIGRDIDWQTDDLADLPHDETA
jgi:tRNA threonylcarbamoyladenosine biosynthesis protein TsaE